MFETFAELLEYRSIAHPERIAFVAGGSRINYRDTFSRARRVAEFFRKEKIRNGDRIGILDYNSLPSLDLWHGSALQGVVPVFINWRLSIDEMKYIAHDSGIRHLFVGSPFLQVSESFSGIKIHTISEIEELHKTDAAEFSVSDFSPARSDILLQLYTSGTTGNPRGVLITHGSMLSMLFGLSLELPRLGAASVNLVTGPLFNIAGSGYSALGLFSGVVNILAPKFDPKETVNLIQEHRVSNAFLAPAMIGAILRLPGVDSFDFSSLESVHYGGSPMPLPTLLEAKRIMECDFTQGYGLTETTGITTLLRYDDHRRGLASNATERDRAILLSAGRVVPGMELKIVDENGSTVEPGKPGEIWIRGRNMAEGYWSTGGGFGQAGGYFRSGDIGFLDDDGYIHLMDRKNDMIVSGGVNIYPAEVERAFENHRDILELAVIGIPDDRFGERPCLVVVSKNKKLCLDEILEWVGERIARFKLPAMLHHVDELPRNPSGKVLRRILREPFWEGHSRRIH